MILILHILIASASLVGAGLSLLQPSQSKLRLTYGLIGATFVSGFYLVFSQPAHLVHACISGLIFLSISMAMVLAAKHKLDSISVKKD